jgi:hypothetical protein
MVSSPDVENVLGAKQNADNPIGNQRPYDEK